MFGLRVRGVAKTERDERLRKTAGIVELSAYLDRKPAQLSGGQRAARGAGQGYHCRAAGLPHGRAAFEPDAQLRHEMRVEIRALQQRLGMTMVYVTHDQTEAMTMADQIILMRSGRIEQAGAPDALYNTPATAFVARFIGAPPMNLMAEGPRLIGVRPENLRLGASAGANEASRAGKVSSTEYLGADTIVTVESPTGDRIAVRHSGVSGARVGDAVNVIWRRADERLFDAVTGKCLEPGAAGSARMAAAH